MRNKKEEQKKSSKIEEAVSEDIGGLTSKEDLKSFLLNIRDKISEEQAASVYAMAAFNNILNSATIYELLDDENKELARNIWLRLKQSGLQLRNPPLLFGDDEIRASGGERR